MCSGPFSCHRQVEVAEFRCFHVCVRCLVVLERNCRRGSSLHANLINLCLCCIYRSNFSTVFRKKIVNGSPGFGASYFSLLPDAIVEGLEFPKDLLNYFVVPFE